MFGNGTLGYLVIVVADDTSFLKMVACVVTAHLYCALHTLAY